MVEFSIFNLMGQRKRENSIASTLSETVKLVQHAERANFDCAWFAEHHFSNYCICPSPLLMVSHIAAQTKKIRLGPAVVVVPLYHPIRLLSEIGMVSGLSGGRLNLGIGSGYQPYEFDRFGASLNDSKDRLSEFIDLLEKAFGNETFNFQGKFTDIPETAIITRPEINPPIWIAGDSEETHRIAARKGFTPIITGRWGGSEYLAEQRERINVSFAAEGKSHESYNIGILRFACVTESDEETIKYLENARYQLRLAASLRARAEVMDGALMIEQPILNEPTLDEMADNLAVGRPETVAEKLIADIRSSNASHVMLNIRTGDSTIEQAHRTIDAFKNSIRPLIDKTLNLS
ncbi:MAG: LLM class flavin-dependent oxidoreductase [Alphaproteobacteria bacterium]|nr:LLM class flavin-dependent oxidoreductase [Alphaproteobacteria bacterium]|tara:strand:- start:29415 stop:30458 length:1044 start_codon:yes stop_codon:yes gene_type:complete